MNFKRRLTRSHRGADGSVEATLPVGALLRDDRSELVRQGSPRICPSGPDYRRLSPDDGAPEVGSAEATGCTPGESALPGGGTAMVRGHVWRHFSAIFWHGGVAICTAIFGVIFAAIGLSVLALLLNFYWMGVTKRYSDSA